MKSTLHILEISTENSFSLGINASCLIAIHPAIMAQVRVIDLSLSSEEIQEVMLTQLLHCGCKKLLSQHLQLRNDKELLQDKLVSEEVRSTASIYHHMREK